MNALFDLTFRRFAAPVIAKVVYLLLMVVIALYYLFASIAAFSVNAGLGAIVLLIIGPLGALVVLAVYRLLLEAVLALINTCQNTALLVTLAGGTPVPVGATEKAPQGQFGQYPPSGQYPPTGQFPQGGQYPPQAPPQSPPQNPPYPPQGGQYPPNPPQYPQR